MSSRAGYGKIESINTLLCRALKLLFEILVPIFRQRFHWQACHITRKVQDRAPRALLVVLLGLAMLSLPGLPAHAEQNRYYSLNGHPLEINRQSAFRITKHYIYRNGWNPAQWGFAARYSAEEYRCGGRDKLVPMPPDIAQNESGQDSGTPDKPPRPERQPVNNSTTSAQYRLLQSEKDGEFFQRVYNPLVKPCGIPGWFLPGAIVQPIPPYTRTPPRPAIPIGPWVPNCYEQPLIDSHPGWLQEPLATKRDRELFYNQVTTFGVGPISDTQFEILDRENNQRKLELTFYPERWNWTLTNIWQIGGASAANSFAGGGELAYMRALRRILYGDAIDGGGAGGGAGGSGGNGAGALINIANEQCGVPTAANNPQKIVPQAVWMVQRMYTFVFVPLAILFLLPGAVISQAKAQVQAGFLTGPGEGSGPFEAIIRSIVAIFLIPATQLIVSYSIDVGNSMAYSVKDYVSLEKIFDWAQRLSYNPDPIKNIDNAILNVKEGQKDDGVGNQVEETQTQHERQLWLSQVLELIYNMVLYLFSTMLIVLSAYQLVFMCYLFLLGPLAAAFYAWPALHNKMLFRNVFGNWLNAVIVLSMWRFFWMVIMAVMTQRIDYINGDFSDLQWEIGVFTCLLGMMLYVPFHPWDFNPAQVFRGSTAGGSQMLAGADGKGGIMGAVGAAAQAGGVPASVVQSMQGQINEALGPVNRAARTEMLPTRHPHFQNTTFGHPGLGQQGDARRALGQDGARQSTQPPPPATPANGTALPQGTPPPVPPPPVFAGEPGRQPDLVASNPVTPQTAPPPLEETPRDGTSGNDNRRDGRFNV